MNKLVVLFAFVGVAVAKPSPWGHPLAYNTALLAPSAVSHQSRVDLVSSPILAHASPVLAYGAPLAQPPHHPAIVLSPHGVPLDTIEVVAARAAHLQAKALAGHGLHYLKKRSLYGSPLIGAPLAYSSVIAAPAALSHQSRIDIRGSPWHSPLAYSAPLHLGGAYGIHPW